MLSTTRKVFVSAKSGTTRRYFAGCFRGLSSSPTDELNGTQISAKEDKRPGDRQLYTFPFDENGEASSDTSEMVSFPAVDNESKPVLLNSKEHAVGYLSRILNARVYEAAVETELQSAKNLSSVRTRCGRRASTD